MSDKLIADWYEADRQWGKARRRLIDAGYRYDGVWTKAEEVTDE